MWKYASLGLLPIVRTLWKRFSPALERVVLDLLSRREDDRRKNSGSYGGPERRTPTPSRPLAPLLTNEG